MPRIGRERFDVAALAFGINRIEGKRAFAGTGYTADHGQSVVRYIDVDILEVVRARAADNDVFIR